jgi:3-phenylpropionate/trans-cinnamate dioxygenase ferredoxin component
MAFVPLFPLEQLQDQTIRKVKWSGKKLIVVKQGDDLFALADRCSHEDYALSEGFLEPGKICCSMHGAGFDLKTGAALSLPAYEPVTVYPVQVKDGMVEIDID